MIEIITTSHSSEFILYIPCSLTGCPTDTFSDLGIMLAVFEQPGMDHSKLRNESLLFCTNNLFLCDLSAGVGVR